MIKFLIVAYLVSTVALAALIWFGRNRELDSKFKKLTGLLKALLAGAVWPWYAGKALWQYVKDVRETFRS
jgi:hypothetical protein